MIIYTRENGYGTIDIDGEQFQLGRRLYEAQALHARAERGEQISQQEALELIRWYCELVQWTGQLRADYRVMLRVAEGKAVFREN